MQKLVSRTFSTSKPGAANTAKRASSTVAAQDAAPATSAAAAGKASATSSKKTTAPTRPRTDGGGVPARSATVKDGATAKSQKAPVTPAAAPAAPAGPTKKEEAQQAAHERAIAREAERQARAEVKALTTLSEQEKIEVRAKVESVMTGLTFRKCMCGCERTTKRTFAPGHDAKYKARLTQEATDRILAQRSGEAQGDGPRGH